MQTHLVLHPLTAAAVDQYIDQPAHALLITGASGIGKASLAGAVVSALFAIPTDSTQTYEQHPYVRVLRPVEGKAIPVEAVRDVQKLLTLRIPGAPSDKPMRAIVIEDAQLLTTEAQNALLRTLEEPPLDTVIILTAPGAEALLPTIRSRVRQLAVLPPGGAALTGHFEQQGHTAEAVRKALLLSGELPGLTQALLHEDTSHPLVIAATHARGILGSSTYGRLLLVDGLSKQKQLTVDILYVLGQMAHMSLLRATDDAAVRRWQKILTNTYNVNLQLSRNTQTKLVLTNLMLDLS